ncbi:hypothetical protein RHSIM_RhsimUnG0221100 [Rhododendron simsii]|uniref:GUN4-like domain-containing protein n=1 Tax=Rhododendron simsii TaxID=118357 RepID=A0A834L3U8_RHOSS|nr:hypothetical protein RHSIM_RhsimUnG0221100 [Rhododendron simsii]
MATNSLQSLHHHHHSLLRLHPIDSPPTTLPTSSLFLKPSTTTTTTTPLSHSLSSTAFSLISPTTPSTTQTDPLSFDLLHHHLSAQDFWQADEETRRLLIALAGDQARKRGYVFFSEVQFISPTDLQSIDGLWRAHSDGRFGYSVQRKIWKRVNKDFTRFFMKVGWMKKLDTEMEQYNYRAFPNEFIWELNEETPEGHLPLTNALRGTQLLNSVLSHPAFDDAQEDGEGEEEVFEEKGGGNSSGGLKTLGKGVFKSDYSF